MGCFPCFDFNEAKNHYESKRGDEHVEGDEVKRLGKPMIPPKIHKLTSSSKTDNPREKRTSLSKKESVNQKAVLGTDISAQKFTFRELSNATKNFKADCFLGEGGFGRVYKGCLPNGQIVAVKQLDRNGLQGTREFLVEVIMLCVLHHPNLVNLIGYCYDGEQQLLVYEFMPLGSLEDHLHATKHDTKALDWTTRMNIAAGAARGLEHLHDKANPPVIYRDFKAANILLDEAFNPKLSDFGLAKLGPSGDKSHVSTRVMGTYGYCAPEYAMTGQLTIKSDVYSFGVVLLELITGRRAFDSNRPHGEQSLVAWARPKFNDRKKLPKLADPRLEGRYPMRALYQALAIASMCIQEDATSRPLIADVVTALSYLASQTYDPNNPLSRNREKKGILNEHDSSDKDNSPKQVAAGILNVDFDREKAIAEAKMWGRKAVGTSSNGGDV